MKRICLSIATVLQLAACQPGDANPSTNASSEDIRGDGSEAMPLGKRVKIIATGGTIAGTAAAPGSANYDAGTVTIDAILAAVPDLVSKAKIDGSQLKDSASATATNPDGFVNVPSPYIRERHWLSLTSAVKKALDEEGYDAVVVTHGTDSIEETAFWLQMTVRSTKPVVLVGAMRPAVGSNDPDGPDNIRSAVRVALDPRSTGKGVMVVQNFTVAPAFDIVKMQSYAPNGPEPHEALVFPFASPTYGDFAKVVKTAESYDRWPVTFNADNRLFGADARALNIKFDVSGVTALPKVAMLYESVGDDSPSLVTNYYRTSAPDVKAFITVGAGGQCSSTEDMTSFVKDQAEHADLAFVRTSRVPKVWCKHTDPKQPNSMGVGTMSSVHAKILVKLLQLEASRGTTDGTASGFREYVRSFFAANVPYPPEAAPPAPLPMP